MAAYWHYLAEASVSVNIVLQRDVQAGDGSFFPAGSPVDRRVIDACACQYSPAQVESIFSLHAKYDAASLQADLQQFLRRHSTLFELFDSVEHRYFLTLGADAMDAYDDVAFRFSIFKVCLPFEFHRTLFCLWLIIFESVESERDDEDFKALFLTGLCHDLGLLEVNPQFTRQDHDPRSSRDDIDGYYSHVSYGAEFLGRQPGTSAKMLRSIEQHHETMDGTGYPSGCSGNMLAEYGQHIHLYDTLYSIYSKNYEPIKKSLADLIPVIEINAVTHFGQVAKRILCFLKRVDRSESVFFLPEEFLDIQRKTKGMALYVEQSIGAIQTFTEQVGFRHDDKTLFVLQNSFIHIALAYYKLRILYKQAVIGDSLTEEGNYLMLSKALEDNFLSLREIIFHINKFLYRLRLYVSKSPAGSVSEQAQKAIDDLSRLTLKLLK